MAAKTRKRDVDRTQVITAGSNIRFEPSKSSRQAKPKPATFVVQEINPVGGFFDFLRQHAVVGLIIGFVIGTQVQTLVKQLVQSFIDPLTQLLFGQALSSRTFTLHFHGRSAPFGWGALVYALIIFIFVLIVMYIVVKLLKLEELDQPKDKDKHSHGHETI
jgi:large-conductance mechanosensitive channel